MDDTASLQQSGALAFDLLANDTDADSDVLVLKSVSWDSSEVEVTWYQDDTISVTYVGDDLDEGETAVVEIGYDVSDGKLTDHGTLSITVHGESEADVNLAPILAKNFKDETVTAGSIFGLAFDTDFFSDPNGDTLTYSAMLDTGKSLPSWLVFDAEDRSFSGTPGKGDVGTIAIVITASDGQLSASDTFELTIESNSAPTDIKLSKNSIAEDAAPGTVIGKLTGVDPDAGDSLAFSMENDASGLFDIVNGKLVLADGAKLDFETTNSYIVTVRVVDSGGLSYSEEITIKVTHVVEPIVGTAKSDNLHGGSDDDVIMGLGGNDLLDGGKGADELDGGKGVDTAVYSHAAAAVTTSLLKPLLNEGEAGGDSYISIENLTGSKFGDKLTGNKVGNTLDGGRGNDMLTGGASSDLFIFGAHYGKDTIVDLVGKGRDHDVIDLSNAAGITSYKDLVSNHLRDIGHDLQITTTDGSKLILAGLDANDIGKADFLF
jgi:Ca2+-binding RTX toxin-like protein